MRVAPQITLTMEERETLTRQSRSNVASVRLARRAQIILLAAAGLDNRTIAAEWGIGRVQVGRWRERYIAGGLASIERDLPRSGRKPIVDAAEIVRLTTQTTPKAATHWSTRTLAKEPVSQNSPLPFTNTSPTITRIPNHLSGRQRPTTSRRKSSAPIVA